MIKIVDFRNGGPDIANAKPLEYLDKLIRLPALLQEAEHSGALGIKDKQDDFRILPKDDPAAMTRLLREVDETREAIRDTNKALCDFPVLDVMEPIDTSSGRFLQEACEETSEANARYLTRSDDSNLRQIGLENEGTIQTLLHPQVL